MLCYVTISLFFTLHAEFFLSDICIICLTPLHLRDLCKDIKCKVVDPVSLPLELRENFCMCIYPESPLLRAQSLSLPLGKIVWNRIYYW
jgi:hypothetical protein